MTMAFISTYIILVEQTILSYKYRVYSRVNHVYELNWSLMKNAVLINPI